MGYSIHYIIQYILNNAELLKGYKPLLQEHLVLELEKQSHEDMEEELASTIIEILRKDLDNLEYEREKVEKLLKVMGVDNV